MVCRFAGLLVCRFCRFAGLLISRFCWFAGLLVCRFCWFAGLLVCRFACLQVCNFGSKQFDICLFVLLGLRMQLFTQWLQSALFIAKRLPKSSFSIYHGCYFHCKMVAKVCVAKCLPKCHVSMSQAKKQKGTCFIAKAVLVDPIHALFSADRMRFWRKRKNNSLYNAKWTTAATFRYKMAAKLPFPISQLRRIYITAATFRYKISGSSCLLEINMNKTKNEA